MSEPLRWGLIGTGWIADSFAADLACTESGRVVAVGSRRMETANRFADRFDIPNRHASYEALVADPDVDVVYIATTHAQHHEHALLALNAGKPVLVEKAFTLNARQAREVVAVARSRRLFCMEAMWLRFHPLIRAACEIAASGRIGEVVGVRADLSRRFEFDPAGRLFDLSAGGGALLDLGVYPATFAWLVLGRPDSVSATGALSPTGSDVTVAMQWGYGDGRVAQVYCSAAGASPYAALITGTAGWIRVESRVHRPSALTVHTDAGDETVTADEVPGNGYGLEISEVSRCLGEGLTESPLVPLDDTIDILDVIDEARRQLGVRYPADSLGE